MAIRRFIRDLGFLFLRVDAPVLEELHDLARQEHRSYEAVAADLLSVALDQRKSVETQLRCWNLLTPREEQITALICSKHTNAQIAARLFISPTTVSTHVRNILNKFNLHSKAELRQLFSDLDFSDWS